MYKRQALSAAEKIERGKTAIGALAAYRAAKSAGHEEDAQIAYKNFELLYSIPQEINDNEEWPKYTLRSLYLENDRGPFGTVRHYQKRALSKNIKMIKVQ